MWAALFVCVLLGVSTLTGASSVEKDAELDKREVQELAKLLRRVIGGTKVKEGKWPWLASIEGEIPTWTFFGITITSDKLFCGASVIDSKWILTAAHCFNMEDYGDQGIDPQYWTARFGDTDRKSSVGDDIKGFFGDLFDQDEWKDWVIDAEGIYIHPGYRGFTDKWKNDIALIKLKEPVPVDPKHVADIQKVQLATANDTNFPTDGQKCMFKGWGCQRGGGRVSSEAHEVELPKMSDFDCGTLYGYATDSQTRLCAGKRRGNRGICSGDSGGPLVCWNGQQWVQVGVASFTAANHPGDYPGVFTRVSGFIQWIKHTIRNN